MFSATPHIRQLQTALLVEGNRVRRAKKEAPAQTSDAPSGKPVSAGETWAERARNEALASGGPIPGSPEDLEQRRMEVILHRSHRHHTAYEPMGWGPRYVVPLKMKAVIKIDQTPPGSDQQDGPVLNRRNAESRRAPVAPQAPHPPQPEPFSNVRR